jgi:hypothetical protein
MVVSPDCLITLDARALTAIKNKAGGNGKLSQVLATYVQSCELWTLSLSVAGLCGVYPATMYCFEFTTLYGDEMVYT